MIEKWGYLRETSESACKCGIDEETGLHRTGLDEYLKVIFPNITDWIHDKPFGKLSDGTTCRKRPDYMSKSLRLIVEFDGIQHYQNPEQIFTDIENTKIYESEGYKVVRIPYFIQLTNKAVKKLFNVDVKEKLFNVSYPSLRIGNGSANLCVAGIRRMAKDFKKFPDQYKINIQFLLNINDEFRTGANLLISAMLGEGVNFERS